MKALILAAVLALGGGGDVPPQQQTIEDLHNHETHPSFWHEHTQATIGSIIGTLGLVVVAWLGYKGIKGKKSS